MRRKNTFTRDTTLLNVCAGRKNYPSGAVTFALPSGVVYNITLCDFSLGFVGVKVSSAQMVNQHLKVFKIYHLGQILRK